MSARVLSNLLGLFGAAVGGAVGFFLFGMLLTVNLYGLVLPGALLGLGCHLAAGHRSVTRGIVCGLAALILSLVSEWYHFAFKADPSFRYFLTHLDRLDRGWWAYTMIAVGSLVALWWGSTAQFPRTTAAGRPSTTAPRL